jgi:hypothetical protein
VIEPVVCCFCGKQLPYKSAVLIVVYPTADRDESQSLYAHRAHLVTRLIPGMSLHPALVEKQDDDG